MRNIPPITKNLLIINILVFLATQVLALRGVDLASLFGLHFFMASDFRIYQLVTYMFLHAGFMHLLFNMFALWMFGCVIESVWGPRRFLLYYMVCGVGAGIMQELAQLGSFYFMVSAQEPVVGVVELFHIGNMLSGQLNLWTTIGASGAVYAILLAFGMLFPNERMFIFPLPVPIKAKWLVMFYVFIELWSALGSRGDGVAHMAHLGGMLFGFMLIKYWRKHPYYVYGSDGGRGFFDSLKRNFDKHKPKSDTTMHAEEGGAKETDMEYNARKKAEQDEIDRILDKIRKSGYDSLTKEEKKKLFDSSNND
ncbi:MAG: rhomboid family intramembrane serine protease [Prevotella sp.]|nr:rhomboid family intramembrane serine protease [Prevotella sp.]